MDAVTRNVITIGELSRRSGLSAHTIRFYEAAKLLRPAARAPNGHRRYREDDLAWLEFVVRLKLTGMPLAEIRQYAELRAEGDPTLRPRLAMLELHRQRLVARMKELADSADALDTKIRTYRKQVANAKAIDRKART